MNQPSIWMPRDEHLFWQFIKFEGEQTETLEAGLVYFCEHLSMLSPLYAAEFIVGSKGVKAQIIIYINEKTSSAWLDEVHATGYDNLGTIVNTFFDWENFCFSDLLAWLSLNGDYKFKSPYKED